MTWVEFVSADAGAISICGRFVVKCCHSKYELKVFCLLSSLNSMTPAVSLLSPSSTRRTKNTEHTRDYSMCAMSYTEVLLKMDLMQYISDVSVLSVLSYKQ